MYLKKNASTENITVFSVTELTKGYMGQICFLYYINKSMLHIWHSTPDIFDYLLLMVSTVMQFVKSMSYIVFTHWNPQTQVENNPEIDERCVHYWPTNNYPWSQDPFSSVYCTNCPPMCSSSWRRGSNCKRYISYLIFSIDELGK